MRAIDQSLAEWKASLCSTFEIGGLLSRNATAHKWKAPFRSLMLRENVAWRTHDLLEQSLKLYDFDHLLGARILLRSAFETVAVLIYLNQLTRNVLADTLDFHDFSETTSVLLLGCRDKSTRHKSLNIVTILEKCNTRYQGIKDLYAMLSESAHPNHEGICIGYSNLDKTNHVITFSNKWKAMCGETHIDFIDLCTQVFYAEYNEEWPDALGNLEAWIEENDARLEATKRGI